MTNAAQVKALQRIMRTDRPAIVTVDAQARIIQDKIHEVTQGDVPRGAIEDISWNLATAWEDEIQKRINDWEAKHQCECHECPDCEKRLKEERATMESKVRRELGLGWRRERRELERENQRLRNQVLDMERG